MAMREESRIVPSYADALNYYVMRLASGSTNVEKIDPENSIYASVDQLKLFGR
jgi:hypothetical protein